MKGQNVTAVDVTERIREELSRERELDAERLLRRVLEGRGSRAWGNLLLHSDRSTFRPRIDDTLSSVRDGFTDRPPAEQKELLRFLVNLAVGLRSYLPYWRLRDSVPENEIEDAAEAVTGTLSELEAAGGATAAGADAARELHGALREAALARVGAEGISEEEAAREADGLAGSRLGDYVENVVAEIRRSNFFKESVARSRGETVTELGNDYAAFLQYMIWLGGSFVTTNPVLIKVAWDLDSARWNERIDALIRAHYSQEELRALVGGGSVGGGSVGGGETSSGAGEGSAKLADAVYGLNSTITMMVVEENCRLLRDIFLSTGGRKGYVSLQVNPKVHSDSDRMVEEATRLYGELEERLGGVPNVVFKLPATSAGLEAARELAPRGIGVTITVNFSLFQTLPFGEVLKDTKALVSYIALMNGRLAYPVRDEMKEQGTEGGVEAARWSGVEIARKAYHRLYDSPEHGGLGADPGKVRLLIASLRDYDDWLPDISELWGCPVITVFPNMRRAFDRQERDFDGASIEKSTPPEAMETLKESEIFRQGWWLPGDSEEYKPKRQLTLAPDDSEEVASWTPVAKTLGQFIDLYEQMGEMVRERMKHLAAE